MAVIFRPRTIGLSGGIIRAHSAQIMKGVREEFCDPVIPHRIGNISQARDATNTVMLAATATVMSPLPFIAKITATNTPNTAAAMCFVA